VFFCEFCKMSRNCHQFLLERLQILKSCHRFTELSNVSSMGWTKFKLHCAALARPLH
jgi:hypothetical protein